MIKEQTAKYMELCAMQASPEALSRLEVCAQAKICCLDHGIISGGGQQEVLRLDVPAIRGLYRSGTCSGRLKRRWSIYIDVCRQVAGEQLSRIPGQSMKAGKGKV